MSLEYVFAPNETVMDNISRLSSEQSCIEEKRICELSEIAFFAAECAEELREDGMDNCEVLSLLSDSLNFSEINLHGFSLKENIKRLINYLNLVGVLDRIHFSSLLLERLAEKNIKVTEEDFMPATHMGERFVYVKNPYSDEAYDVFSQDFSDPRVKYAKDIKQAVSAVSNQEADFCLLPLEDRGVRLNTVEELIFKTDLKINSVTPVFGLDGCADMKYAMVSSSHLISDYSSEDDRYLEIRIAKNNNTSLTSVSVAAEEYGLDLYRVNSLSIASEEGESNFYSVILRVTGAKFTQLLVYLTLFAEDYTILGIYKNLE